MKPIRKLLISLTSLLTMLSCGNSNDDHDATGSFEATEIIVSSEGAGKIVSLDLEEGQQLEKGTPVGTIDSTQLYLQKMALLSNRRGVQVQRPDIPAQTAAIEEQIATLQREHERVRRLIIANAATQKQLDDINSQIDLLQKQLSAQTSSLQKSSAHITAQSSALEIEVARLDDRLQKCIISSPLTGIVLNKYANEGELVNIGTPLFKVADLEKIYLRAYITNDQLSGLKLNDKVTIQVDAGEGEMRSYEGTITWISGKSEFTPKTIQTKNERANLVYALKITVKNDGFLKIGMYGEVTFNRIEEKND